MMTWKTSSSMNTSTLTNGTNFITKTKNKILNDAKEYGKTLI